MSDNGLDLDELEKQREEATVDKVDLFDFYNKNWSRLIDEIRDLQEKVSALEEEVEGLEYDLQKKEGGV